MRKTVALLGALLFTGPLFFLALSALNAEPDVLRVFWELQALEVIAQTFGFGVMIAFLACTIGGVWGYACATYNFPGRKLWLWLLPAPLAVPVYVYAFVYLGIWQALAGHSRPAWLLVALFTFASAPYAYLLSFQAFRIEPRDLRETSELMDMSKQEYFWLVRWPLARPLIFAAFFVVLAEFIADFGAVQLFHLRTFSTAIYSLWTSYLSFGTASLVSLLLALGVAVILFFQARIRSVSFTAAPVVRRKPRYASLLTIAALIYTTVAFVGPVVWLIGLAMRAGASTSVVPTVRTLANTAALGAVFAMGLTIAVSIAVFCSNRRGKLLPTFLQFGYAMPGTILAVAVTVPFFYLQRWFDGVSTAVPVALVLMFFAWSVRFLKVAWEPIGKTREAIPSTLEEAAVLYEPRFLPRWRRLLFPLLRTGVLSSFLFLFIEAAKELPIALLTRPLGWETLSIKVFEFTSESDWQQAATPALLIVGLGCVGLASLLRKGDARA